MAGQVQLSNTAIETGPDYESIEHCESFDLDYDQCHESKMEDRSSDGCIGGCLGCSYAAKER